MSVQKFGTMTSTITNVPKREESRAKRHFHQIAINQIQRWKCNYCAKNYGLNTSTTSLWKHLEKTHPDRLTSEDTKQKSGNERYNLGKTKLDQKGISELIVTKSTTNFTDSQPEIQFSNDEVIQATKETILATPTSQISTESSSVHSPASDTRKHSLNDFSDLDDIIYRVPVVSQYQSHKSNQDSDDACQRPFAKRLAITNDRYHDTETISQIQQPFDQGYDDLCQRPLVKRLAINNEKYHDTETISQVQKPSDQGYGFVDLVSDIVMLKPGELERFQDILLQNAFLQQTSWWDDQSIAGGVAKDRILSRQRQRLIDTMLGECGWKFDMNIYPVSLFRKTYLVLDLVYRKESGEHRACFLDCLELPDEYPMELLSIMIFRKLCEFHVEDKLWQVFVGNTQLRGLTEILRKIFRENNLSESLECEIVDFSKQVFTVKQETHEATTYEFLTYLNECRCNINKLYQFLNPMKTELNLTTENNASSGIEDYCNYNKDQISAQRLPSNDFFYENSKSSTPEIITTSSNVTTDDNLVGITILRTSEVMRLLQDKVRHFQQEIRNISSWFKNHLFIAYHMCCYCFYVCNDVNVCRNASRSAKSYLADLIHQLSARKQRIEDLSNSSYVADGLITQVEMQRTITRMQSQLYRLVFQEYRIDEMLISWDQTIGWWQSAMANYQQLRETISHHVVVKDAETSSFSRNFEKASKNVPPNVCEEKWMKYMHWKIWRDFQRC